MIDINDFIYESEVSLNELVDFIIKRYPQFKFKKTRCDYCHKILYTNEFPDNESIEILEKCTNLEAISIELVSEGKLSKLNQLKSSTGLSIYIITSIIC